MFSYLILNPNFIVHGGTFFLKLFIVSSHSIVGDLFIPQMFTTNCCLDTKEDNYCPVPSLLSKNVNQKTKNWGHV